MFDLRYRASDDLLICASKLLENHYFDNPQDMLEKKKKPHHWKVELEELSIEVRT